MTPLKNMSTAIDGFGFLYAACRENLHTEGFQSLQQLHDMNASELMRGIAMGTCSPLALARASGGPSWHPPPTR